MKFTHCIPKITILAVFCSLGVGIANLSADTVAIPVSVGFPYSGAPAPTVNGNVNGQTVSVGFPYSGAAIPNVNGNVNGQPISVGFPYSGAPAPTVNGNVNGQTVSVAFPYLGAAAPNVNGNVNGQPVSVGIAPANTLDPDLVGLWRMEGDWGDSSGNNNNGYPVNTPTFSTDRKVGIQAGSFNGSSSYVSVPNSASLGLTSTMTLEAWIKPSDIGNSRQIISKFGASGGYSYQIGLAPSGNIRLDVSGDGTTSDYLVSTSSPVSVNNWQHVAATFNAGVLTLYVNGVAVAGKSSTITSLKVVTTPLDIGCTPAGSQYFSGLIDEVAIYKRALSAEEIASQYGAALSDPNAPAPPVLNSVPSIVGTNTITLSGTRPSNTSIWVNNKKVAAVDSATTWTGSYGTLQPGLNILNVVAMDASSRMSQPVTATVYYDNASPVTQASLSGTKWSEGWYSTSVTVTLSATDQSGGAGVDKTEYSLDNLTWLTYTAPFVVDKDGKTTVYFRSTDKLGNIENPAKYQDIAINKTSLVGLWHMDGDWKDASVVGNDGTPSNGVTFSVNAKIGTKAGSFDGVDDIVAAGSGHISFVSNTFTIEFWANPTATRNVTSESNSGLPGISGQRYAIAPQNIGYPNAGTGISVGTNGISVFEHSGDYLPSLLVYSGTLSGWNHIAVVYENKQPRLYLNGQLVRTGLTSQRSNLFPSTIFGNIGNYGPYKGLIDEVSIYNRALSGTEIEERYRIFVVNSPTVDPVASPTTTSTITLSGTKPADTAIVVNGATLVPLDGTTAWQATYTLSAGTNNLSVTALDNQSFNSQPVTLTVVLDVTPPQVTGTTPPSYGILKTAPGSVTFSLTDAFSPLDLTATLSGATVTSSGLNVAGVWSSSAGGTSGTVTFTPTSALTDGTYTATIKPTDTLGNGTTYNLAFTIDTTPPLPPVIDPITAPINTTSRTITGAKSSDSTSVVVNCAGVTVGAVTYPTVTSWSVNLSGLKEGANTVTAYAVDAAGNQSNTATATITVDTIPPAKPSVTIPASPTNGVSVTLTGGKEANSYLYINNIKTNALFADATWSYTVNLSEGNNSFTIFAKDEAGNQSQTTGVTVVRDTTPPTLASSTPVASGVTNSAESISVTLSDTYAGVDLTGSLAGALLKNATGSAMGGTWSVAGNAIVFTPTAQLPDGTYVVIISPVDTLGNKGTASFGFTLDRAPPTAQGVILNPASPVKAGTVYFTITFSEPMTSSVQPTVVVSRPGMIFDTTYTLAGSWLNTTTWKGSYAFTADSGDATYTVKASGAKDIAGNTMVEQAVGVFVLDTTPPAAPTISQFTTPTRSATQTLTGSKEANTALVVNNVVRVPLNSATSWSYNCPLAEGTNTLTIIARDAAGNDSPSIMPAPLVTLDTTPPTFTIDTYKNPSPTVSQVIAGTREPGSVVKLNGVTIIDSTDQNPTWSYPLSLTDGITNRLVFTAADALGNTATKTLDILCDTAPPPSLAIGMLVADGSGKGTEVSLSWPSYVEVGSLAYYRVYYAATDFTGVTGMTPLATVSKGTRSFKVTGLVQGTRYWFAVAPVSSSGNFDPAVHTAQAVPADTLPPEEVTGLSASAGYTTTDGNYINLSWISSVNSKGDLTDQVVYLDAGQGYDPGTSIGKTATTFRTNGLSDATSYKFKITVKDGLGHESAGSVVTGVTRLANPTGLTSAPGNQKVSLTWNALNSPYLKLYNIYRLQGETPQSDVSTMTLVKSQAGSTFTDTGLVNGTTYQYAITTLNTSGAERTNVQSIAAAPRGDTTGPVIGGLNLIANQVITAPITITATAADAESATGRIELWLDGTLVTTQNNGPLNYAWNIVNSTDGNHTVKIVAYDAPGNSSEIIVPVVVSLAPPTAPVITSSFGSPINYNAITINGTAQAGSTISLRVNGVVVSSASTSTSTFSFTQIPVVEGDNYIAAKAANRGGESSFSSDTKVTVVTAAPSAPVNLVAKALAGGSIQFSWQMGNAGAPSGYNLYEVPASFTALTDTGVKKTNSSLIPYLLKEYIPADDTPRSYLVTAVDGAGNESPASNLVQIASDRLAPAVGTIGFTDVGGVTPTDNIYGPGTVQVALTVSEALGEAPFLSLEAQNASPVVVSLRKLDATHYAGSFTIDAVSPHGPTTWKFSGKDLVGNRGNSQGSGITFDVKGPAASITMPVTLLKTSAGLASVAVAFDEPSVTIPMLELRSGSLIAPVTGLTSSDNGLHWTGTIDPAPLVDGTGQFALTSSQDRFGNKGNSVKSGASILLFKENPPAPAVPENLVAKPAKGGSILLNWMRVNDAQGYNIYRQGSSDTAPLLIKSIASGTTVTWTDSPTIDGNYRYSISSAGLLASESARSSEVIAVSDRTPPAVPAGLALSLTGNGVQASWQGVQTAGDTTVEVPASYRLYRGTGPITDANGVTPVVEVKVLSATDPAPASNQRFYVVTALDSLGNESAPSASQEITFPVAPVGNLILTRVDDGKPSLSWVSGEANLQGYYIYRNGARINQTPTISTSYIDGYYASGAVSYGVSAVDANGTESPIKEVTLPVLSIGLKDGTVMHRGLLETVSLIASLPADAVSGLTIDAVAVKIGTLPESTENGPFALVPGTPLEIKKVAASEANAPPQEAVVVTAVMHPAPGVTVKLTRSSLASVLGSGTAMEIFNDPLVRGTQASVRIKVNNLGSTQMSFLTSENNGPTSHVTVYLKDQDGNVLAQGNMNQRTGAAVVNSGSYATARIEPGGSFLSDPINFAIPASAPYKVSIVALIDATYYHYNQDDQVVAPGLKQAIDATIADVSYMANASTDKSVYRQGESVIISGQAISTSTAAPIPNVPVRIGVTVNGFDRFFIVNTDAGGAFSYTFIPASNEAGSYSVWAAHPDLTGRSIQTRFSIIGLAVSPKIANVTVLKGKFLDIPVTLANLGGALTGLSFTPSASNGVTAEVLNGGINTLAAGESRTVTLRLSIDAAAPALGFASLAIATAEGLTERVEVNVSAVSAIPLIVTSPSYIDTGIVRGSQRIENFSITNTGLGSLDNARIDGPSLPWLSLTIARNLGNIPPGQRNNIGILMQPPETIQQGVYNDRLVIYSDNHIPFTYNIQVTVTSSAVGSVQFSVLDELMKDVGGAAITLQHQTLPELYYTLTTAADGTVSLFDIPEGRYSYNVSAAGHKPYSGSFVITPGISTTVPVALEVTLVSIEWSVTPVVLEDRYQITVSQTFATNVPTAVIVTEPPNINLPDLQPGQVFNGEFTITNYGLTGADYKGLSFPTSIDEYDVEVLANMPARLNAMQKITVPYRITRRQQTASVSGSSVTALADNLKSYGSGSCSGSVTFTSSWSYVICPGALNERTVSMTSTSSASWNSCTFSATGNIGGGGISPIPTYGPSPGIGSGQTGGGYSPPSGAAAGASTSLPDDDGACIYPRRPNDCPKCNSSVPTGSSVDVGNGTYSFSETDLRIPARSIPIELSRTYRSNQIMKGQEDKGWNFTNPIDGPLGFGWYSPWFARVGSDGTYIDGEGNYIAFAKDANGAFLPNTGNGLVLIKTINGFELRKRGDNTLVFDNDGWLRKIRDAGGNAVILNYGANGKLATVTDVAGRTALSFSYNGDGRVMSVTDIAGRTVSYSYDNIGNLTGVNLTAGGKNIALGTYTYDMTDYGKIPMKCDYSTTTSGNMTITVVKCYTDQLKPEDQFGTYCKTKTWNFDGQSYSQSYCVAPQYQNNYHNLTSKRNAAGETYTLDYQPTWRNKGIVRSVTDPSGRKTSFTYSFTTGVFYYTDYSGRKFKKVLNNEGKLVLQSEILPDGSEQVIKSIAYQDGRIEVTTDAAGTKTTEQNDEWGNVIRRVDGEGNEWRYVYTPEGKLMSSTDPLGTISRYEYDAGGNRTKETIAAGTTDDSVTTYLYNQYNQLTATIQNETATIYGYDDAGNLTTVTDPQGNSTAMTYDLLGNLTSRTVPLAGTTTFENHDYKGNPQKVTDPNGNIVSYTYDDAGRVITVTDSADNGITSYTYVTGACSSGCSGGGSGKIASITLPEGNKVNYDYDSNGNLAKIIDNDGNYIAYTYDVRGNKIKEEIKDPSGTLHKTVSHQYDILSRLTKSVNPDQSETIHGYDKRGNRTSLTNPNGNITIYSYDAANRLTKVTQPENVTTSYSYDKRNNLTSVTDANANTTQYEYDKQNRLIKSTSPDTGITTYSYDKNGNLKTKTDAKQITATYNYDAANRMIQISFPNPVDNVTYTYDTCTNGKGKICIMIDPSGTTSYEYSKKGQLTKETRTVDNQTFITEYSYDRNGNNTTLKYPSGRVVTYTYANDKITQILNNGTPIATNIGYKPFGGLTTLTFGNGIQQTNTYDNQYRIQTIAATGVQNLGYSYDRNGNITNITDNLDPTKSKTYGYDQQDRLTSAQGPWGSLSYGYDGVGNRKTENHNNVSTNYSYKPNTNQLITTTGEKNYSFGFDQNGNTNTENNRAYIYNQNQRLIRVTEQSDGQVIVKGEYVYDDNGQRVKKETTRESAIFFYNQQGRLLTDRKSTSVDFIWHNRIPLAKADGSTTYFYHCNHLATPQKITNATKEVVSSGEVKPFGDEIFYLDYDSLRFPGQYKDTETGMNYNYYRTYNPIMGRYLEADPIGIKRGTNHLYVFVQNNPVMFVDEQGLSIDSLTTSEYACLKQANGDTKEMCKCLEVVTSDPNFLPICESCMSSALSLKNMLRNGKKPGLGDLAGYKKCVCVGYYKKSQSCCECEEKYDKSIIKRLIDPSKKDCGKCC